MSHIRRVVGPLALAALTFAAALGVAPAVEARGVPSATAQAAGYNNCGAGWFCMYSDWEGGGTRCRYHSNVSNTADACSFIRQGKKVLSVWNGSGKKATYYKQTNYNDRVGSTNPGHGGNLMGSYQIRSIKF